MADNQITANGKVVNSFRLFN